MYLSSHPKEERRHGQPAPIQPATGQPRRHIRRTGRRPAGNPQPRAKYSRQRVHPRVKRLSLLFSLPARLVLVLGLGSLDGFADVMTGGGSAVLGSGRAAEPGPVRWWLPAAAGRKASCRLGLEHLAYGSPEADACRNAGERRHDEHGSEHRGDQPGRWRQAGQAVGRGLEQADAEREAESSAM
jgi:hypothetical protein